MSNTIILILLVHCVADFWFQTPWMAANKSKDPLALLAHVATYMFFLTVFAVWHWSVAWLWWALVNGALHMFTDSITSRITSHNWNGGKPTKTFWNTIGVDQFIHAATLILTYEWMVKS